VLGFAGAGIAAIAWGSDASVGVEIAVTSGRDGWTSSDVGQSWHQVAEVDSDSAALWIGRENAHLVMLAGLYDQGIVRLTESYFC